MPIITFGRYYLPENQHSSEFVAGASVWLDCYDGFFDQTLEGVAPGTQIVFLVDDDIVPYRRLIAGEPPPLWFPRPSTSPRPSSIVTSSIESDGFRDASLGAAMYVHARVLETTSSDDHVLITQARPFAEVMEGMAPGTIEELAGIIENEARIWKDAWRKAEQSEYPILPDTPSVLPSVPHLRLCHREGMIWEYEAGFPHHHKVIACHTLGAHRSAYSSARMECSSYLHHVRYP